RVACFLEALRDTVHCPIERSIFPVVGIWRSVLDGCPATFVDSELVACSAFRAKLPFADWRIGIAFDVDDLLVDRVGDHAAADGAVRADGRHRNGILDADRACVRDRGCQADAERAECTQCGRNAARQLDEVAPRERPARPRCGPSLSRVRRDGSGHPYIHLAPRADLPPHSFSRWVLRRAAVSAVIARRGWTGDLYCDGATGRVGDDRQIASQEAPDV